MFRKQITQVLAAILLFTASFVLLAPSSVYAQSYQNSTPSSRKCDSLKDRAKKKECERKENKIKKNDHRPNHDAHDDHGVDPK